MALTNNDIIKKLRVALSLKDTDIIEILKLVDYDISKTELSAFFRAEDHEKYVELQDQILRNFLNGLVIYKRGKMERKPKSDADQRAVEKSLPPKEFRKPLGVKPKKKNETKAKKPNVTQIGGIRFKLKGK
ncbi:DUF1456 family protein [Vicingaceae bacterium]|nr:DUF1456 family protein [Vicingaceae bacterium]MDC1451547.1 DUF1456 family protein [Vicingaceae bacterium]